MILIDDRVGSKDLVKYLPKALCTLTRLEYADCAFLGSGPKGHVPVGVEIKTINDLLNSLHSGRFVGHQLPGMKQDYEESWLLIQGEYRCERGTGILQIPRGPKGTWVDAGRAHRRMMFRDLQAWITTFTIVAGIHVWRTRNRTETAQTVLGLYRWWRKGYKEHHGWRGFDRSGAPTFVVDPPLVRRVAKELEGVDWVRSAAVADHFKTVFDMVLADEKEWESIDGIGRIISKRVVKEIRG